MFFITVTNSLSIDEDYAICSWFLLNLGRLLLLFLILIIWTLKYFSLFPYFLIIIFFFLYDTHLWVKSTHYLKKREYSLLFFDYKMEYSLLFFDYKMEYPLLFFDYFSLITKWNTHCFSLITILQYVELCLRKKN